MRDMVGDLSAAGEQRTLPGDMDIPPEVEGTKSASKDACRRSPSETPDTQCAPTSERELLALCGEHLSQLGLQLRQVASGAEALPAEELREALEQSTRALSDGAARNSVGHMQTQATRSSRPISPVSKLGTSRKPTVDSKHASDEGEVASSRSTARLPRRNSENDLLQLKYAGRGSRAKIALQNEGIPQFAATFLQVVESSRWETFWAVVILMNILIMMVEEEYYGMREGHELDVYSEYGSEDYLAKWWPGSVQFFVVAEFVFAALFTVELCVHVTRDALRACFRIPQEYGQEPMWKSPWDMLDCVVVVSANLSLAEQFVSFPFSLNVLRILKLVRLLRLLKLVRRFESFDPVMIITTALRGSLDAMVAAYMLLCLFLTLPALFLTSFVRTFYLTDGDSPLDEEKRTELFLYFGTYTRSMVSMFELALANWPPITRFMMEELHELFGVFCLVFKLTIGFAVINVINGVFIKACFNAAENDDVVLVRNRRDQIFRHKDRMTRLFQMADENRDGKLCLQEFRAILQKPVIKTWLEAMDLRCSDADNLFQMLAGPDNKLTVDQLVNGVARLRGPARNIDIVSLFSSPIFSENVAYIEEDDLLDPYASNEDGGTVHTKLPHLRSSCRSNPPPHSTQGAGSAAA